MKNRSLHFALLLALSASPLLAASITGTVTNKTSNKPAASESVTLLNMASGMEEAGTTKTDGGGHFKFNASGNGPFMIRVDHQKSAYYKNLAPGATTADLNIYDVAAKVDGISTEANILRVEAQSGKLTVAEIYYVKNNSQPARTQQSDRTYEIYIPAEATLDSTEAMGPSGMAIPITPVQLGEKGHYALNFPIRPNDGDNGTSYQLVWHVNYSGSYKVAPKLLLGAGEFAVMLPKSMSLKPEGSSALKSTTDVDGAQTWLAKGVAPAQSVAFTVSGTGSLPQAQDASQNGGGAMGGGGEAAGANAPTTNGPGGGLGAPIDTPDALQKYKYWILGSLAVILAIIAGFMLRKPANIPAKVATPTTEPGVLPSTHSSENPVHPLASETNLIASLKEELFTLETERIQGKVTDEEYASHKAALEVLMRRALR